MYIKLRFAVPEHTTTKPPVLQYSTDGGHTWKNVPTVVIKENHTRAGDSK